MNLLRSSLSEFWVERNLLFKINAKYMNTKRKNESKGLNVSNVSNNKNRDNKK